MVKKRFRQADCEPATAEVGSMRCNSDIVCSSCKASRVSIFIDTNFLFDSCTFDKMTMQCIIWFKWAQAGTQPQPNLPIWFYLESSSHFQLPDNKKSVYCLLKSWMQRAGQWDGPASTIHTTIPQCMSERNSGCWRYPGPYPWVDVKIC